MSRMTDRELTELLSKNTELATTVQGAVKCESTTNYNALTGVEKEMLIFQFDDGRPDYGYVVKSTNKISFFGNNTSKPLAPTPDYATSFQLQELRDEMYENIYRRQEHNICEAEITSIWDEVKSLRAMVNELRYICKSLVVPDDLKTKGYTYEDFFSED